METEKFLEGEIPLNSPRKCLTLGYSC